MSYAYAVNNALAGLAASAFTLAPAPSDLTTRAYLNDSRLDRQVVFGSGSTVTIVIDLGSATSLRGLALLNSNISDLYANPGVTSVAIAGADDAAISVNVVTPINVDPAVTLWSDKKDLLFFFSAASTAKRYWRVTIAMGGAAVFLLGEVFAIRAGGLLLSDYRTLSRGSAYGSGEGEEIVTVQTQFQGGDARAVKLGGPIVERRFSWADFTQTQREELRALWGYVSGPTTPFLWIDDNTVTSAVGRCIFGRLQLARFDWVQDDYGVYQPPGFVIRSMGREIGA